MTSLPAHDIGADFLVIFTGVEKVAINFNESNQQGLDRLTLADAKRLLDQRQHGTKGRGHHVFS